MKKGIATILIISIMLLVGLTKVNAEEIGTYVVGFDETYYSDNGLTNQYTIQDWYQYTNPQTATSLTQNANLSMFYFNNHFNLTPFKGGYITIPFEMYLPIVRTNTTSTINGEDYCERWDWGTLDSYNNVTRWNCARYATNPDSTITDYEYVMPRYSINVNIVYNTGYVDVCNYNQNNHTISCPITQGVDDSWYINFLQIYTKVYYSSTQSYNYYIYLHKKVNAYSSAFNQLIEAQNQNTQEIINQNATYNDQPKEETEGKNETADYEQKEQQLMGSLDFNMTAMDNITINPNASAFVWQIADRLRSINPAIILLMTSILGMGLIKLILNR